MFLPSKYQDYKRTLLNLVLYVDFGIELGSLRLHDKKVSKSISSVHCLYFIFYVGSQFYEILLETLFFPFTYFSFIDYVGQRDAWSCH